MTQLLRDFISLLYPRNCISCQRILITQEEFLCFHCVMSLPKANCHLKKPNPILEKLCSTPKICHGYAYLGFSARGIAQKMIHKVKYENLRALGSCLGQWFGHEIIDSVHLSGVNLILPVPLHKDRLKARGYNQSDLIAQGLAEVLELPLRTDLLTRERHTSTQTKKSKTERWVNVENLFKVSDLEYVKGKHILLVDDVITTGATIESAAQELVRSGCAKISIACLASGN